MKSNNRFTLVLTVQFLERFSFFSLAFSLVLFASEPMARGGLGWSEYNAICISGLFSLFACLTPFLGGLLSDNFFGYHKCSLLGLSLSTLGYLIVFFNFNLFWLSFILLIFGSGFYRACSLSLVTSIFKDCVSRRSQAYSYFNLFVNLGSFLASIFSGIIITSFGYKYLFLSCFIAMFFAAILSYFATQDLNLKPTHKDSFNEKNEFVNSKVFLFYSLAFVYFLCCVSYGIVTSGTLTLYIKNYCDRFVGGG